MSESTPSPADFNQRVIEEFRANGGQVGGMFAQMSLALLTTVGARSGQRRVSPVAYFDVDGQRIVVASAGGAPKHPAWYHNLTANPQVTVEVGTESYPAVATPAVGAERDELFAKVVERSPGFADYQAKTSRVIPIVKLDRAA